MVFLVAYLLVFASAAFLTVMLFGRISGSAVSVEQGLGLFFPLNSTPKRRKLFGPSGTMHFDGKNGAQTDDMLSFLEDTCCVLPVKASTVRVLTRPTQFYEELKKRIRASRHSIVMSALYIGDGPLSRQLVECLEEKVTEAAQSGAPLDICLLLDHNRMHDRRNLLTLQHLLELAHSNGSTSGQTETSGSSSGLDERSALRVRLCLFQTPCRWNRLFAPFGRAKEALGVQHTKIFCFDGVDTILTGANLSDDYFATRMDRYVIVEDNPHVGEWFASLVHTLCALSHPVVCRREFATSVMRRGDGSLSSPTGRRLRPRLHARSDLVILPNTLAMDPSSESAAFSARAAALLRAFATEAAAKANAAMRTCFPPSREESPKGYANPDTPAQRVGAERAADGFDTFLFPTLQFARAGVFHDSLVVQQLLRMAPPSTHIYLTSPYLNMYADFVDELLSGQSAYDLITASVNTNGWRGAKGFAGYIPFFYLQLERAFFYLTRDYGCGERVRVREFSAEGLTFHAKGVWFATEVEKRKSGPQADNAMGNLQTPYLVAYGSTNYGYRSVHKDVESEVFLFTTNTALREALREELVYLLRQSTLVTEKRFVKGSQGRFQPVISLIAQMGQDFL